MDKLICHTRFDETTLCTVKQRILRIPRLYYFALCIFCFGTATLYMFRDHWQFFQANKSQLLPVLGMYGLGAFYLWFALTIVNRSVKRTLNQNEELWHAKSWDITTRFTETEIVREAEVDSSQTNTTYSAVKRLIPYKNLILLKTKSKLFLIIDRTRFENGTEDDFWRLMNEKCPNAVPQKHRR